MPTPRPRRVYVWLTGPRVMVLNVVGISRRRAKGYVVLADQTHDPAHSREVRLEFPMPPVIPNEPYLEQEARVVSEAERVLEAAIAALKDR